MKKVSALAIAALVMAVDLPAQDLHEAVWNGDIAAVKGILEKNPELLNRVTPEGETALHWAVKLGHVELARLLIAKGANLDIKDKWEITPLQLAVENGYVEIVGLLIQEGLALDGKESHYGRTLLHLASINGHLDVVNVLIDKVDVNATDNSGRTALYYAYRHGNRKVAQTLEAGGARRGDEDRSPDESGYLMRELGNGDAVVWYLGSCGWAIKTVNHLLIFDYWDYGRRPAEPSLSNGHVHPEEIGDLNVYVFATHSHIDHYDPVIYEWEASIERIKYIFGWEAREDRQYDYLVGPRAAEKVDGLEIYTINSQHVDVPEVAYLVTVDGLTVYFNGDYAGEVEEDIDYLAGKSEKVDLAFAEGAASVTPAMLEKLEPAVYFPMHGRGIEFEYKEVAGRVAEMNVETYVACAENRGDTFLYSDSRIIRLEP